MPSAALRIADLRAIQTLSHDCRDLGDDAHVWRNRFAEGLSQLVRLDLVFVVEMDGLLDGRPQSLGAAEWGWHRGLNRTGWDAAQVVFQENPGYSEGLNEFFARLAVSEDATFARPELIGQPVWQSSVEREFCKAVGIEETAYSFHRIADNPQAHSGILANRATGEKPFSARDTAILAEVQQSFAPLVGRSLARFAEPSPATLPPRVREVLRCMLEGDGDKQIAARLNIRPHTVNQYVKAIHKHFGVSSRAELLARWIKRGWGTRFAWA